MPHAARRHEVFLRKMVSVILPTYNGSEFIRNSINSVLSQSYSDLELIIVDDHSTDDTPAIVDEIAESDSRVRVIHNETNKKLPASLNIGFSYASGDYLTWTSDDNYFAPEAVKKMVDILEKKLNVDIVYTDYDLIDVEGNIIGDVCHREHTNIYEENIVGACFLYRRAVQEKLKGYDETLFLAEDYDFWLRAKKYFNYMPLYEKLYYYRVHGKSLTGSRMAEIATATDITLLRVLENNELSDEDRGIIYKRLSESNFNWHYDRKQLKEYMTRLKEYAPELYENCGRDMKLSINIPKSVAVFIAGLLG